MSVSYKCFFLLIYHFDLIILDFIENAKKNGMLYNDSAAIIHKAILTQNLGSIRVCEIMIILKYNQHHQITCLFVHLAVITQLQQPNNI